MQKQDKTAIGNLFSYLGKAANNKGFSNLLSKTGSAVKKVSKNIAETAINEGLSNFLYDSIKEPSTKEPSVKELSTKEPSTKEPSTKEPSVKEPSVKEPSVKEPSIKEPSTKEPSVKELSIKEPSIKELSIKEPSIKEPSIKEPKGKSNNISNNISNEIEIDKSVSAVDNKELRFSDYSKNGVHPSILSIMAGDDEKQAASLKKDIAEKGLTNLEVKRNKSTGEYGLFENGKLQGVINKKGLSLSDIRDLALDPTNALSLVPGLGLGIKGAKIGLKALAKLGGATAGVDLATTTAADIKNDVKNIDFKGNIKRALLNGAVDPLAKKLGSSVAPVGEKLGNSVELLAKKLGSSVAPVGEKLVNSVELLAKKLGSSVAPVGEKLGNSVELLAKKLGSSVAPAGKKLEQLVKYLTNKGEK